ncbi:hypothetical protein ABZ312_24215 [Streptomyces sp. NPDC006207]
MTTNHPRETPKASACREGPRSDAADTAIIETMLRQLKERATTGELSVAGIARSAGVGKATRISADTAEAYVLLTAPLPL